MSSLGFGHPRLLLLDFVRVRCTDPGPEEIFVESPISPPTLFTPLHPLQSYSPRHQQLGFPEAEDYGEKQGDHEG